jgi:hypothetical protein
VNDDGLLVWTGGADFTEGFSKKLWGTDGTVATADGGEASYLWGIPIKVLDYSPACVAKNPGNYTEKCQFTDILPFGNTTPDFNLSFGSNFRYKSLSVNALVESSMGHSIYNGTAQWSLRDDRGEDVDQTGKPLEHTKSIAYVAGLYLSNNDNAWFREDGDWIKVRELSLGYTLPESVVSSLFGETFDRITLNAIGRNLLTITDYRGYDPEVGGTGGELSSSSLQRVDNFGYPNFRAFTFSAELVF